jgi:hypothetical protein
MCASRPHAAGRPLCPDPPVRPTVTRSVARSGCVRGGPMPNCAAAARPRAVWQRFAGSGDDSDDSDPGRRRRWRQRRRRPPPPRGGLPAEAAAGPPPDAARMQNQRRPAASHATASAVSNAMRGSSSSSSSTSSSSSRSSSGGGSSERRFARVASVTVRALHTAARPAPAARQDAGAPRLLCLTVTQRPFARSVMLRARVSSPQHRADMLLQSHP